MPRTVLGIYDHPADPDLPFVKSRSVGDNFLASTGRRFTSALNEVGNILDRLDPLP